MSILDGHIIKLSEVVLSECLSEFLFLIKLEFYVTSKTSKTPYFKVFLQSSKTTANSLFEPVIACNSLFELFIKKDPVTIYQFLFSLLFSYNNIVVCY